MIHLYGYKCCSAFLFSGINFSPVRILFAFKASFHVSVALAVAGKCLSQICSDTCSYRIFEADVNQLSDVHELKSICNVLM